MLAALTKRGEDAGNLGKQLDEALDYYNASKLGKLARHPLKSLHAKAFITAANALNAPMRVRARLFFGDEMDVVLPDCVSSTLFFSGFFEEDATRMVIEKMKPGMTFFDVGAHFGYFSVLGSRIVGSRGQVHAFEPTPSTFKVLESNAKNRPNMRAVNKAVFSSGGRMRFNDFGLKFSSMNSFFSPRIGGDGSSGSFRQATYSVAATTIDEYVSETGAKPSFIKIDAESADLEVLKGAEKTISRLGPMIVCEGGDAGVEGAPKTNAIVRHLAERGYSPYEAAGGRRITRLEREDYCESVNILFMPE